MSLKLLLAKVLSRLYRPLKGRVSPTLAFVIAGILTIVASRLDPSVATDLMVNFCTDFTTNSALDDLHNLLPTMEKINASTVSGSETLPGLHSGTNR